MTAPASSKDPRHDDTVRRRLVPPFDAFYGSVLEVLELLEPPPRRVLDLGAGTGLLSAKIHDAYPEAELVLVEPSAEALDVARERLAVANAAFHPQDLRDPLPGGEYDAVVSALAIQELENDAKRDLFARILGTLRRHGVFINAEHVTGPSAAVTAHYLDVWARQCRALGATDEELAEARERMQHDRCADTASLMQWVLEAGFADAGCVFKSWWWVVIVGWVTTP
jgi:tRNA (cmo5U34)-methyltransferase